jgi:bifunctional non-homologous end joining protein LigD
VDFTYRFPAIAHAIRGLPVDGALIDGEAVVLRNDGRSDFLALMAKRAGAEGRGRILLESARVGHSADAAPRGGGFPK